MMTVEELLAREEIRCTLALYNISGDRARAEDMAGAFTVDGILEVPNARYEGRDTILRWITGVGRNPDEAKDGGSGAKASGQENTVQLTFIRHHITTCHIELTGPDTATARTYYAVYTDIGPDHCGYYADAFRKEDGRWLIAHRKARLDWRSPQSIFTG